MLCVHTSISYRKVHTDGYFFFKKAKIEHLLLEKSEA